MASTIICTGVGGAFDIAMPADGSVYFSLQRMDSKGAFIEIAEMKAIGNSSRNESYTFDDSDIAESKIYYYRLVQYDLDGKSEVLPTIAINVSRDARGSFMSYPNPVFDKFTISYGGEVSAGMQMTIYSTTGELVRSMKLNGYNTGIEIESLHSGIYLLKITDSKGANVYEEKIIKL